MAELYRKIDSEFNFSSRENEINSFWDQNSIFQKSLDLRRQGKRFIFYEGPPTANGLPHIGHALSRTIKDTVCRYKTMKGFLVNRKAGWDTHGLPVELEIEKQLGISTKAEIEKFGIEKFNAECRKSVFKYKEEWDDYTRKLGYWLDLSNPYITYTNDYIETVWWILKSFWEKGLLYKGHKILPWCPRCQTALSSHEVAQGYKDVSDPSIFVTMKLKAKPDTYFLVWTTTPWTLISNVAVALHPDQKYVTIHYQDKKLILAEARLHIIPGEYEVVASNKGSDFLNVAYEPLYNFIPAPDGHRAVNADFVTMEDGSGIVHIAPAFGADDYEIGLKENLPVINAVDTAGNFIEAIAPWAGKFVKAADPEIISDLKTRGLMFAEEKYLHNYPFCWRCDSPLIYYARSSWFIRTTAIKDKMIAANSKITWYPEEIGKGRFGEWLENNIDWALSRERYWGTPLPVWICEKCEKQHCVGSQDELKKMAVNFPDQLDMHRPYVDQIKLRCPDCGGNMTRVTEVIDAWFDSGSMPYGQVHYPFENKDHFEEIFFPADFIAEGLDQTRGWFYSMLAISIFISGRSSYRSCLVNNLVLDSEGRKLSKRMGNYIDPKKLIVDYGADAVRWYLMSSSQVWLPKKFDLESLVEVNRRFFSTFQNSFSFFALYANIEKFKPADNASFDNRALIDRWIISRLHWLIEETDAAYSQNDITRATRAIADFAVEDLSNWYVRRNRRRFWGSTDNQDTKAAFQTLFECLLAICKLAAPVAPFLSEDIYRRLTENLGKFPQSVHLCDFPETKSDFRDKHLEAEMEIARRVVELGRAARKESKLRIRQPLKKLVVLGLTESQNKMLRNLENIVSDEINVKSIDFDNVDENYYSLNAEGDFKKIGPKFGNQVQLVASAIKEFDRELIVKLIKEESLSFEKNGIKFLIDTGDVKIKVVPSPGYSIGSDGSLKVAIDLNLDEDLIAEGHARELVNKIQNLRKSSGLDVTDRIKLGISANAESQKAIGLFAAYIKSETLAEMLVENTQMPYTSDCDLNGTKTIIALEKI